MLYAVGGLLALFLCLLARWQRHIDAAERARVLAEIGDAKARGANRPVGQFPQVDADFCIGCASCARACPEEGVLGMVDGVVHVIQASKCIGHARCAEACPVGAITVGLGDVSSRPDIPRLGDELETTVPGVYIAGELGGMALIRSAVEQGTRVMEAIAGRVRSAPSAPDVPDVLIAGAGPAGLAATLKAIELGLSYVTVDQSDIGGTVRKYPRRKLVMTQPVELPLYGRLRRSEYRKEELIDLWDDVIRRHRVRIRAGVKLLGASRSNGHLEVETSNGPIQSRFMVLALGRRGIPRRLGVAGEEHEKVLYQLIDAATYTGQHVLVVGGGDSAVEAAMALAEQPGNAVTLSYRKSAFFRLKKRNEERIGPYVQEGRIRLLFSSHVRRIGVGEAILTAGDGEPSEVRLPNDYVFVFAGGEPPYPLLKQMGIRFWKEEAA